VNGDEVRDTWFLPARREGYNESQVDDLLLRLAAELDAGRPAGPLIRNVTFTRRSGAAGYDVEAVDWFLEEFLRRRKGHPGQDRTDIDPWRDLPVVNLSTGRGPAGLAERPASSSRQARRQYRAEARQYFSEECQNAWRDFAKLTGVHLWWRYRDGNHNGELRTADQQTIASERGFVTTTVSTGGRSFRLKDMNPKRYSGPGVGFSGLAELASRRSENVYGHFNVETQRNRGQPLKSSLWSWMRELADETGLPVLYTTGSNFRYRAAAAISFPDGRWLRFLVRGTEANAIMTAVDQAGNRTARYRNARNGRKRVTEIIVHPGMMLSDELVVALAISAGWLTEYFSLGG
jgi:DivIVA domain-containing protein